MSERTTGFGSGVLIRVADLDAERGFYRDRLMLGDPLVDSGFWVEFAAPDGTRIVLEKSEAKYLEHEVSATTLLLSTPHLEAIREQLHDLEVPLAMERKSHPGEAFYRGQDLEGNVFYLCGTAPETNQK